MAFPYSCWRTLVSLWFVLFALGVYYGIEENGDDMRAMDALKFTEYGIEPGNSALAKGNQVDFIALLGTLYEFAMPQGG